MEYRELTFDEIELIWEINRSEYIKSILYFEKGNLKEKTIEKELNGWPVGEEQKYNPILKACYKQDGFFYGGFDNNKLKAIVVLDSKWIGCYKDTLQLEFLHIDKKYRKQGVGKYLFNVALQKAREMKAKRIYISSCENKNTVKFYLNLGCKITEDIVQELYELEPGDIHMEYIIK